MPRSSITGGAGAEVVGLDEFRRGLKQMENPSRWARELGLAQRKIGREAGGWARFEAQGMGGPFAHFADSIKGTGGVAGAKITIDPVANAAYWGAKKRTGWYADDRFLGEPSQHPPWVGNSWDVAVDGQGPYAINPALAAHVDDIVDLYGQAIDRVAADAFDYRNRISTF